MRSTTRGSTIRSNCCSDSVGPTAAGRCRSASPERFSSRWRSPVARAGGTRFARSACCAGATPADSRTGLGACLNANTGSPSRSVPIEKAKTSVMSPPPGVTSLAMHLLDRMRAAADRVIARVMLVGADPHDDEDLRARKALLVLISVLILPVAALWGALYLAFGSPVGVVPLVYFGVLLGAIAVFSRTRDFPWLLRVGQIDILLAPTLSMIPLGGFLDSGGVGLWGILAPLGALVFSDVRSAIRWYVAYPVVFLGSGIAGEVLGPIWPPLPGWFTSTMLALNIAVGGTIVF